MTTGEAVQLEIIDKLKLSIVNNDMVATRALLNSVRYEENESFGQLSYDIIALDYIIGLNFGVAPGATPYPTISDLKKWIDAKGLTLNPYAVRNSIISKGTSWHQIGGSDIVADAINTESFKKIIDLSTDEIQLKIKEQWQLLFKNNP